MCKIQSLPSRSLQSHLAASITARSAGPPDLVMDFTSVDKNLEFFKLSWITKGKTIQRKEEKEERDEGGKKCRESGMNTYTTKHLLAMTCQKYDKEIRRKMQKKQMQLPEVKYTSVKDALLICRVRKICTNVARC